jgi:hypothetical protein
VQDPEEAVNIMQVAYDSGFLPDQKLLGQIREMLEKRLLSRTEIEVVDSSSTATAALFLFSRDEQRPQLIDQWNLATVSVKSDQGHGFIQALFKVLPLANPAIQAEIVAAIHRRWVTDDIEIRAPILSCLAKSSALLTHTNEFFDIVEAGIDDYTTNVRGDVGSLLRIEAVKAAGAIFKEIENCLDDFNTERVRLLFSKALRLAVEKLDKIRTEAQMAISFSDVVWNIAFFKADPPNTWWAISYCS